MKRIKDYTDKGGNRWEVYTRDASFWRYYYMGKADHYDGHNGFAQKIQVAFAINKGNDYNGHKQKVISENLEAFASDNLYQD